jgi:DNA mismatch endonuclease (patch repair protein)
MVDFLTPQERSRRMARIRSRDTVPEVALRKALHAMGFRYRVNDHRLPGRPDIVLPRYRTVVFVHGCFWHRHEGCSIATTPKSNTPFWREKFNRNVARDSRVSDELSAAGWKVIVVWECRLQSRVRAQTTAAEIAAEIRAA